MSWLRPENMKREKEMKDLRKLKVRFQEVMDERQNNEEWININNKIDIEDVHYAEIKETNENSEKVKEAKGGSTRNSRNQVCPD